MEKRVQKLQENLYYLEDSCNVYLIKKGSSCVLIDFGTGRILDFLQELSVLTVEAILITHHHRDQVEGLPKANALGIPVFVPENEKELLTEADELWQRREVFNNYNCRQDRFSVLNSVKAEALLDYENKELMGMRFHILPTPGHTTGSISILTELADMRLAFTGDLIYAPGKVWSLAATQWSYNGGEGIAYSILSLLDLQERELQLLLPSHGMPMPAKEAIALTVERLAELRQVRRQNPRLFLLREAPYERITEHVLMNRTSMANSYVLLSKRKKALLFDFGYDFMAGVAAGTDRSARRPWLYTIPILFREYGVESIDACIPTHYHDDHVAGMNLLKRVYGAKLLCAEDYAPILEQPDRYDLPCLWYEPILLDQYLSYGKVFQWEEYEITLFPLPGHTRFASAAFFMADGKRILLSGDQYSGEEVDLPNYVYKNIFSHEDFIASAALLRKLRPDWILSGHWQRKEPDESYYQELERIGRDIFRLHQELLPEQWEKAKLTNDFPVFFLPYQKKVRPGEVFKLELRGLLPELKPELLLPQGFLFLTEEENEGEGWRYTIKAANERVRRARIGCRVSVGGRELGTQAEMLVTVE